jgi:hypothetical protein
MNKNAVIASVVAGVVISIPIFESIKYHLNQRKVIAGIQAETKADLDAISKAEATVQGRIADGVYDGKGLGPPLEDFKFYWIAAREEDTWTR